MQRQRIVIVRSDKCTQSSGENTAEFVFPVPITLAQNEQAYVQLLRVSFPHSFYLINSFTDKLVISGTAYTLTHGTYSAVSLLTHLRSLLPISIEYSPSRFRYTFTNTSAFQIGSASTVLRILGIKAAQCDTDTTSLESGAAADLHGIHLIKVLTNFDVDSLDSSVSGGYDSKMLAMIPVEEDTHAHSTFKYEHWKPTSKYKVRVYDRVISELKVSLLDIDNRPVDFNCVAWSAKIVIVIEQTDKQNLSLYQNAAQAGPPSFEAAEQTWNETVDATSDAGISETSFVLRQGPKRTKAKRRRKPARKGRK